MTDDDGEDDDIDETEDDNLFYDLSAAICFVCDYVNNPCFPLACYVKCRLT